MGHRKSDSGFSLLKYRKITHTFIGLEESSIRGRGSGLGVEQSLWRAFLVAGRPQGRGGVVLILGGDGCGSLPAPLTAQRVLAKPRAQPLGSRSLPPAPLLHLVQAAGASWPRPPSALPVGSRRPSSSSPSRSHTSPPRGVHTDKILVAPTRPSPPATACSGLSSGHSRPQLHTRGLLWVPPDMPLSGPAPGHSSLALGAHCPVFSARHQLQLGVPWQGVSSVSFPTVYPAPRPVPGKCLGFNK